jgi:hypothetical protein
VPNRELVSLLEEMRHVLSQGKKVATVVPLGDKGEEGGAEIKRKRNKKY